MESAVHDDRKGSFILEKQACLCFRLALQLMIQGPNSGSGSASQAVNQVLQCHGSQCRPAGEPRSARSVLRIDRPTPLPRRH